MHRLVSASRLGVPFGPLFVSAETNSLITPFIAAILVSVERGRIHAEVVRAGILSVDRVRPSAQALGMSRLRTLRRIVLPQAMR